VQEPNAHPASSSAAFERILDRALTTPEILAAAGRAGAPLTLEQLRAEAVGARGVIVETVAVVHRGRGLMLTLAALVLSLGIVITGVYLLCGFGLHALDRRPHIGDGLATAGVIAAAVAAGASVGNLAWLLKAARRCCGVGGEGHGSGLGRGQAEDAWEHALLEHGVMPFLLDRLGVEAQGEQGRTAPSGSGSGCHPPLPLQ
jgi:hypothetical protein